MSMHQQWTVTCDADNGITEGLVCCASDQVSGTKSRASAEFKRAGWVLKSKRGWFCPDCVDEGKLNKPNANVQLPAKP